MIFSAALFCNNSNKLDLRLDIVAEEIKQEGAVARKEAMTRVEREDDEKVTEMVLWGV